MAYRKRLYRRKNLRKRTFVNRMYKKGVKRGLHVAGKFIAKTRKSKKQAARILHKKARRIRRK